MSQEIRFDSSYRSLPSDRILSAMMPWLRSEKSLIDSHYPSSDEMLFNYRAQLREIYKIFDADQKDSVLLTSSGQEAVNQVFHSLYLDKTVRLGPNQYIVDSIGEAASLLYMQRLVDDFGCVGKIASPDISGHISVDTIEGLLTPRTALVSLSWANGLTGVLQDVLPIAELLYERGVALHLEASHVLGKLYFEREDIKADYITFDGPVIHAPEGTGALYIREGVHHTPLILGGQEQNNLRAGSLNLGLTAALSESCKELFDAREYVALEVARIKAAFENALKSKIPEIEILFESSQRLPHIFAASFPRVSNEAMLYSLSQKGIYPSIGGGKMQNITALLTSIGLPKKVAASALSFSLSRTTTMEQIHRASDEIADTYKQLKKLNQVALV